ncbi:DUF4157 domain-containing protein [Ruania alba]|uniref:eCIS core domain-containing protein n=1 Tax=Ruania alba TaxID=648782 RepID=A0A1H5KPQ2_9MICO|nr:DUF4157 domain-containing protein [Ruania alba]SEE65948.1 protein of unknown function [Ruania alba]
MTERVLSRSTTTAADGRQVAEATRPDAAAASPAPLAGVGTGDLVVGRADDVTEELADRRAETALARLRRTTGVEDSEQGRAGADHDRHGSGCSHLRRSAAPVAVPGAAVGPAGGPLGEQLAGRIESARGGGAPLEGADRVRMESAFGQPLGRLRIHRGPEASRLNDALSAEAFTVGQDVFLGAGARGTDGECVLAHEIAHVLSEPTGSDRDVRRSLKKSIGKALGRTRRRKDQDEDSGGDAQQANADGADLSRLDRLIAWVKRSGVLEKDEGELQAGIDMWGSRLAQGESSTENTLVTGAASVGGGGGAYARGAVSSSENINAVGITYEQYQALMELGTFLGVNGRLEGQAYAKLGEHAHVLLSGRIQGFAGAMARARGQASVTMVGGRPVGVDATGSASAFAGAKVKADISGEIAANAGTAAQGMGVHLGAGGEAMAGAEASADGEFAIDPVRGVVAISGKASAFAGAKATGHIEGKTTLYGRKLLGFRAKGEASAGAGGTVEGGFSMRGGNLTFEVFAGGSAGLGAGGGGEVVADLKPLGVLIWRMASKALWQARAKSDPDGVRDKIMNYEDVLTRNVEPELETYRDMKLEQLRMNRATDYVKIEKVQAIIDRAFPRSKLTSMAPDDAHVSKVDRFLESMIEDTFKDVDGSGRPDVEVTVSKGKIKTLLFTPRTIASQLGGAIEGKHAHGTDAGKLNPMSEVGK